MSGGAVVYLVDDDASFLTALARELRAEGFQVGAFGSASQLLSELSPQSRGCILADLAMPDVNGLELQSRLEAAGSDLPIVFLTGYGDIQSTVQAMRHGALDFLEKRAPREELIAAVNAALARDAATFTMRSRLREVRRRFATLTRREREVLQYVVRGRMNKEIAAVLGINERTVKLHRTAITKKIGVHSVAQLAVLSREAGVFEANETPH